MNGAKARKMVEKSSDGFVVWAADGCIHLATVAVEIELEIEEAAVLASMLMDSVNKALHQRADIKAGMVGAPQPASDATCGSPP